MRSITTLDLQYAHRFYGFQGEAQYLHGHSGVLTIEVENVRQTQREAAIVSYDGREGVLLKPGDQIKIYKAEEVTPFIKMKEVSFVKILKEKLL